MPLPDAAAPDGPQADAMPAIDGGPADAAPPSPVGLWQVESAEVQALTDDGGVVPVTVGTTDTPVPVMTGGTQAMRVNGILRLTAAGEVAPIGLAVVDGRLVANPFLDGFVDTYTFGAGYSSIQTTHAGSAPIAWSAATPDQLALSKPADVTTHFKRYQHTSSETITLAGLVTVDDDGMPGGFMPFVGTARAALIFLLRGPGGATAYVQVPDADMPLPGFGTTETDTAAFDVSRIEGALGLQRITFGTNAFLAVALIVVYDDVNDDGDFDADAVTTSCGAGEDCIRGVSPIVLGYRVGSSQELAASPFQYLLSGWTWALAVADLRMGDPPKLGLVSTDPTTVALPTDIVVPEDPANVVVPPLVF